MIILSQTTDILEVTLGGAVTTNQLRCVASWRDITTSAFSPDRTVILTNNSTPVNAVGSPAASTQRVVDLLNVYNLDTVAQTVTVQFNANGTRYVLWSASLAAGESVQYIEGAGWVHTNASGNAVSSSGINTVNGTTAEITASTAAGVVTLSLPTALTFTGKTITGGTFASPTLTTPALGTPASGNLVNCTGYVGTSALVTVGALTSGSIGSGFGSINVGANSITGGAISGTTGTFSGVVKSTNGTITVSLLQDGTSAYVGTQSNHDLVLIRNGGQIGLLTATGLNAIPIGATTPAAGSFTTLAVNGTSDCGLTINGVTGTGAISAHLTSTTGAFLLFTDQAVADWAIGTAHSSNSLSIWSGRNTASAGTKVAEFLTTGLAVTGTVTVTGGATFLTTSSALTNGAGVGAGTITNAPAAGNPTKWIGINDNGTTRYIPAW